MEKKPELYDPKVHEVQVDGMFARTLASGIVPP
jgi:hypothetical protein